jgi:DNA polymerase-1
MQGPPPGQARVICVGEAPGKDEDEYGVPFRGMSGALLRSALARANGARTSSEIVEYMKQSFHGDTDVAFTNSVHCRPPGNEDPSPAAIKSCLPHLKADLEAHPDARLVLLGTQSSQLFLGKKINEVAGRWQFAADRWMLPLYHPAAILKGQSYAAFEHALVHRLYEPEPMQLWQPEPPYLLIDDLDKHGLPFLGNVVAVDIETTGKEHATGFITCISISDHHSTFIITREVAYSGDFKVWLEELFTSGRLIVMHNGLFDLTWLCDHLGVSHPYPNYADTMLMHYIQNPYGLGSGAGGFEDVGGHGLKQVAEVWLGADSSYEFSWKAHPPEDFDHYDERTRNELYQYAAADTFLTRRLFDRLTPLIDERLQSGLALLYREHPALVQARRYGFRFNEHKAELLARKLDAELDVLVQEMRSFVMDYCKGEYARWKQKLDASLKDVKYKKYLPEDIVKAERHWHKLAHEFNPNSTQQVLTVLYDIFKLPVQFHPKTGNPTSDKVALQKLGEPLGLEFDQNGAISTHEADLAEIAATSDAARLIVLMLRQRKVSTFNETFVTGALKRVVNGYIYPNINQHRTETGRKSSSNPNAQNQPRASTPEGKAVKELFLPDPEEVLVQFDYAQAELRVGAVITMDQPMIDGFLRGEDPHATTARSIFGERYDTAEPGAKKEMRTIGKNMNFGVFYNMQPPRFARERWMKMSPEQRAAIHPDPVIAMRMVEEESVEFFKEYARVHPNIMRYKQQVVEDAFEQMVIETPFGRRRPIGYVPATWMPEYSNLVNSIINYKVQSIASDLTAMAMAEIYFALQNSSIHARLVMTVHDSIIYSCRPADVGRFVALGKGIMEEVPAKWTTVVPFVADVEIGQTSWGDLIDYDKWKEQHEQPQTRRTAAD